MNFDLFFIGFGIGLLGVLPVGPVNVMCINRSLHLGLIAGIATGIGGLMADMMFESAALFGIQAIVSFIFTYKMILQTIGGTVLIAIGVHLMRTKAQFKDTDSGKAYSIPRMIIGTFLVTFANPAPLFYFASAFSPLGGALNGANGLFNALAVLAGVACGAGAWWLFLSVVVSSLRDKFTLKWISTINIISGGILVLFGSVIIADYAFKLDLLAKLTF